MVDAEIYVPSEQTKADGIVVVPDFLSGAEVVALQQVCDELSSEPGPADKPHAGTRHVRNLASRIDFMPELLDRPQLRRAVQEMFLAPLPSIDTPTSASDLVGEYELFEAELRSPNPGFGGQRLHADGLPKLDHDIGTCVAAIVPLADFTVRNGATRVVPGSHRRVDLQRRSGNLERHEDERLLCGQAGTAFVFSGHLLHSGTTNRSASPRPALHLAWRR